MVRTKPEDVEDTTWEKLRRGGRNGVILHQEKRGLQHSTM
jgi:hypothetical protein